MSFITKDPALLREFERIIKESQAKLAPLPTPTTAPTPLPTPTEAPKPVSDLDIAKFLFMRLGQNLNGMPNLAYGEGGVEKGPEVKDLQNIDQFAKYLEESKITIDGQRLAYSMQDWAALKNPMVQRRYGSLGVKVSTQEGGADKDLRFGEADYKLLFPEVTKYLAYLQRKAFNERNKVLQVMIGKLINSTNQYYDTGLTATPTTAPGTAPADLPAYIQVDSFPPNYILDPANQKYETGAVELTAGDLTDAGALNNWLSKNGIKIRTQIPIEGDKTGRTTSVDLPLADAQVNFCSMINALYWRAKYLIQRQTNAEQRTNVGFYLRKVQELSSQYTGPDGKVCSITGAISVPGAGAGAGIGGTGAGGAGAGIGSLYYIMNNLPFREIDINLQRMQQFNEAYLSFTSGAHATGDHAIRVKQMIDQVFSQMAIVHDFSKRPDLIAYPLKNTPGFAEELATLYTKDPPGQNFRRLIAELKKLVGMEYAILQDIMDTYGEGGRGMAPTQSTKLTPEQLSYLTSNMRTAGDNNMLLDGALREWNSLPTSQVGQK